MRNAPYSIEDRPLLDAARIIQHAEPARLGVVRREFRGDLEVIALKCMEKAPSRRYESVAALADDIRRYLRDEPILARPVSAITQVRKFTRRNRTLVAASAMVAVVLIAAAAVSIMFAIDKSRAAAEADRRRVEAEIQSQIAREINEFFNRNVLGSADPLRGKGRDAKVLDVVLEAAASLDQGDSHLRPEVESAVRLSIARTLRSLESIDKAEAHLRTALDLRRRVDADRPTMEQGEICNELAAVLASRRDVPGAREMYAEALDIHEAVAGPDSVALATVLSNAAVFERSVGNYELAEGRQRQAIAAFERAGAIESPAGAVVLHNLASLLSFTGRAKESDAAFDRVIAIRRRILRAGSPELAMSLTMHASVLVELGKADQAHLELTEALDILRAEYGSSHSYVATVLNELARVRVTQGSPEQAIPLYEEAAAIYRESLGPTHPYVATVLASLAKAQRLAGHLEDGERLLREAVAIDRTNASPDNLVSHLTKLGDTLHERGQLDEALAVLREAADIPLDNPITAGDCLTILGQTLATAGERDEAERVLLRALELISSKAEPGDAIRIKAIEALVSFYESTGSPEADRYRSMRDESTRK